MNIETSPPGNAYGIDIQPLSGRVEVFCKDHLLASSTQAKVMYETRLPPTIYFRPEDVQASLSEPTGLQTFCPFKGTASYFDVRLGKDTFENAAWSYQNPLPESEGILGLVGFSSTIANRFDLGENSLREDNGGNISGPMIDWLLREAGFLQSPEEFTRALANKFLQHGISISRLSVMIWSLHPQIAGKNYIWKKDTDEVSTFAPSYEIYEHPSFVNSPLLHVSQGLGGVRQKLDEAYQDPAFPIMDDLREQGATDYVAMPLPFSDGRRNVLTLTCDHPDGFTTANLGLVFECLIVISRFYEVFMQKENAQSLLETYVGKRTGARVLGGEIRRGDGDEIDAAIMFCDLRGSTRLEETLGRDRYIDLLNRFFDVTSDIVHDHGGEVLKFIGDAVLAVFPADADAQTARQQALESARDIISRLQDIQNEGEFDECDAAIGIAYGQVTYGNVGSRERLDFTVIGQAANIAARLGDFGKTVGHRIVVSKDIADACGGCEDLGQIDLHNVSRPVHSFSVTAGC